MEKHDITSQALRGVAFQVRIKRNSVSFSQADKHTCCQVFFLITQSKQRAKAFPRLWRCSFCQRAVRGMEKQLLLWRRRAAARGSFHIKLCPLMRRTASSSLGGISSHTPTTTVKSSSIRTSHLTRLQNVGGREQRRGNADSQPELGMLQSS